MGGVGMVSQNLKLLTGRGPLCQLRNVIQHIIDATREKACAPSFDCVEAVRHSSNYECDPLLIYKILDSRGSHDFRTLLAPLENQETAIRATVKNKLQQNTKIMYSYRRKNNRNNLLKKQFSKSIGGTRQTYTGGPDTQL